MIGRVVGHFEIRERIGAGAMGEVYLAWDSHLRRRVALKFLPPSTVANVVAHQRLRREALALSKLNHPSVATLFEFLSEPEYDCLVMEYVEGESLDQIVRRGPLEEELLLRYAVQIADGLAAAHEAGLLHRDLKPANLRVSPQGWVKLLDFGLAKQVARSTNDTMSSDDHEDEGIAGTMAYIAPEIWSGRPYGAHADLYSLGVVLYELATGQRPFGSLSGSALVHAIKQESPVPARELRPALSGALEAVIRRLMSKRPEDRYASARELHADLDRLWTSRRSGSQTAILGPDGPARAWSRRSLFLGALAGVLAAVTIVSLVRPTPSSHGAVVGILPLRDTSADSTRPYFAEGVTGELAARLAEQDSLQVISSTTMLRYRNGLLAIPQIAREVGADRIVQGSVERRAGRVRISLQVVDGVADKIRWSRHFEAAEDEIVGLEDRAARSLASALGVRRGGDARRPGPVNPVAYDLFLRGRFELDRRNSAGIRLARTHFLRSIALDSTFAPAWSGLADAWSAAGYSGLEPPLEVFPQARRAALRAIELDPDLADGHTSLGNVLQNHDWDWSGAEKAYLRALELNPSHAVARHWYANQLALRGHFDQALTEIGRAHALDPGSLPIAVGSGAFLYFARRYDESLDSLAVVLAMDSTSGLVQRTRAASLDRLGRHAEAVRAVRLWLEDIGLENVSAAVGRAYDAGGMDGAIEILLRGLEQKRQAGRYEPATHLAELNARLGRREDAIRWLLQAERERDTELNRLAVDPLFDPLREDLRFRALLARVGLGDVPPPSMALATVKESDP